MGGCADVVPAGRAALRHYGVMIVKEHEAAVVRWIWLSAAVALLWGCTGTSGPDGIEAVPSPTAQSDNAAEPEATLLGESAVDLRELSRLELVEGPGAQELAVSGLLRELGVVHLLESYLINIPPAAEFLVNFELFATGSANRHFYAEADASDEALFAFETRMRQSAGAAAESLPRTVGLGVLDEAFFDVLEQCSQDSAWPDVELFEMHNGRGFPPVPAELIESEFGISLFEYLQLRHECSRHAATYPTLDPAVRDQLLAPQRAHFAEVILDRLDNELPLVEVPARYQAEIEDLRTNGW